MGIRDSYFLNLCTLITDYEIQKAENQRYLAMGLGFQVVEGRKTVQKIWEKLEDLTQCSTLEEVKVYAMARRLIELEKQ